jgi:hypothetical protein
VPIEEWGGISYALAAASAACPPGATIVPLIRVGADLAERAYSFLRTLPHLDLESGILVVDEPNNRVELRYNDQERRCERLTGGVGAWPWTDLQPRVAQLDALYVNFISGFELELATAQERALDLCGGVFFQHRCAVCLEKRLLHSAGRCALFIITGLTRAMVVISFVGRVDNIARPGVGSQG